MSALAFGCFDPTRGWPACDMDYASYECKLCSWDDNGYQILSSARPITMTYEDVSAQHLKAGVCDFNIRSSLQSIGNLRWDSKAHSVSVTNPAPRRRAMIPPLLLM